MDGVIRPGWDSPAGVMFQLSYGNRKSGASKLLILVEVICETQQLQRRLKFFDLSFGLYRLDFSAETGNVLDIYRL